MLNFQGRTAFSVPVTKLKQPRNSHEFDLYSLDQRANPANYGLRPGQAIGDTDSFASGVFVAIRA